MAEQTFLAVDLGASSGRVLAGMFDGRRLRLEELHRFENGAVPAGGSLYWDYLGLWNQICQGLRMAGAKYGPAVKSVGVDTWGVDFALLARDDVPLGNPHSYRDRRTQGMMAKAMAVVPREEIFAQTGLQFMEFNTLYQLLAMRAANSPLLEAAHSLLMIPDFFHWLMTGVKANEFTDATTTQFYNPNRHGWATELLNRLDLPTHILGQIVPPGTRLGPLIPQVASDTGLAGVDVVLPGTHDTASAVMAVPAASRPGERPDWCYISSGTWSLMGVESPQAITSRRCRELNFTNEGGVGGTIRVLKNITGLWLVQECKRTWAQAGKQYVWEGLNKLSAAAQPLASLVNPDDSAFQAPGDMPESIRTFCRRAGQRVPVDDGAVIRCALDSLALKCRQVLGWLEELVGGRLDRIHIVGGGTQNKQLCQATADACRRVVIAGPIEATAIGNLMQQALAAGAVGSIAEAREVIRESFPVETYEPRNAEHWDAAYERFLAIVGS